MMNFSTQDYLTTRFGTKLDSLRFAQVLKLKISNPDDSTSGNDFPSVEMTVDVLCAKFRAESFHFVTVAFCG